MGYKIHIIQGVGDITSHLVGWMLSRRMCMFFSYNISARHGGNCGKCSRNDEGGIRALNGSVTAHFTAFFAIFFLFHPFICPLDVCLAMGRPVN